MNFLEKYRQQKALKRARQLARKARRQEAIEKLSATPALAYGKSLPSNVGVDHAAIMQADALAQVYGRPRPVSKLRLALVDAERRYGPTHYYTRAVRQRLAEALTPR